MAGHDPKSAEAPVNADIPPGARSRQPLEDIAPISPLSSIPHALFGVKSKLHPSDTEHDFVPIQMPDGISSWSQRSDKQLGSPASASDRVFPMRSVVSVDPSQTPQILQRRNSGEDYFPQTQPVPAVLSSDITTSSAPNPRTGQTPSDDGKPIPRARKSPEQSTLTQQRRGRNYSVSAYQDEANRYDATDRYQLFNDDGSEKSNSNRDSASKASSISVERSAGQRSRVSLMETESISGLVTARFKHVVTAEGHAVITGRDGETLQRCEDEPIHIPGAVQSFGVLIALEEKEEGKLVVRVVSENSQRMIGYSPQELFKLNSFTDILSEEQTDNLLDHVDFIRDEEADPASNGPEVFTMSIRPQRSTKRSQKLWCAMHVNPAHPDLIICEFELDDDQVYPLVPDAEETPEPAEDTLNSNPTEEEYAESTHTMSKPLRVLRSARKRKGEAAAMEVFNIMSQVQEQLANAPNLEQFLKILVGVVKELTGFHRVMVYQFDSSFNGRVVTELVDPRATKDLYKGLNFPASDIPKQARDLYKINKVRLLYDRDLETARLVCRSVEDLETPLDLSFSYLRAMSPIHIKYLANMAVRSSMSISINAFNELWGLIACHTYGSKGMRVSFPIRKMCRLVGDTASRNIERLSYASRLQARKLINTVPTEANPSGYIIASSDDLLKLFDADFGLLSIHGETKILGKLEQSHEALAMLEYLRLRKITTVITSQDIKEDFPDLVYRPGFIVIAGLLLVPLSVGGSDFITFFRRGVVREVKWAGNPYEKFVKEGTEGYLEPRKSFKTWSETVVGKCREWTEEQVETAAVLCLVYGKFIEVCLLL
jgi:light-regulated signal transduction histidine kinase (bacteriophytochrome)